ncbi:hypothetical protein LWI28_027497 [Acer negundo]|uniref:Uncharacterized protein n=1 Tax=Acer negundo TaxID=4023 RepID=A0AAD5IRS2_ACENE|nr:hypothetical protein LWI28_027497 [Acer negundo]
MKGEAGNYFIYLFEEKQRLGVCEHMPQFFLPMERYDANALNARIDGKKVRFAELQRIIHDLRRQKRFTQAFHLVCLSETLSPAKIMNDSLKLRKSNFLSIFDPVLKKHTVEQNLIAGGETEGWFWV